MAALLWLGHFPPASVVIVGLITAFAGYTAVYALNDLIDCRVDKERMSFRDRSTDVPTVDEIRFGTRCSGAVVIRERILVVCDMAIVALAAHGGSTRFARVFS